MIRVATSITDKGTINMLGDLFLIYGFLTITVFGLLATLAIPDRHPKRRRRRNRQPGGLIMKDESLMAFLFGLAVGAAFSMALLITIA